MYNKIYKIYFILFDNKNFENFIFFSIHGVFYIGGLPLGSLAENESHNRVGLYCKEGDLCDVTSIYSFYTITMRCHSGGKCSWLKRVRGVLTF